MQRFSRQIPRDGADPSVFETDQEASDGEAKPDNEADEEDDELLGDARAGGSGHTGEPFPSCPLCGWLDDDVDDLDEVFGAVFLTTMATAADNAPTMRRRLRKAAHVAPAGRPAAVTRSHGKQAVEAQAGKRSAGARPEGECKGAKKARHATPMPPLRWTIPMSIG